MDDRMAIVPAPLALASQVGARHSSANLQKMTGSSLLAQPRETQQVISGAGLVMSRRAAALLPPFCGFTTLTMWVDDYVKRILHEALGDIQPANNMSIPNARFQQDRHPAPQGTPKPSPKWLNDYLGRVLRGCMLCRFVAPPTPRREVTAFVAAVKAKALFIPHEVDPALEKLLKKDALERGRQVLKSWHSTEYAGTPLSAFLARIGDESEYLEQQAGILAKDCMRYIDFIARWPAFVRAVDRVPFTGEEWLLAE